MPFRLVKSWSAICASFFGLVLGSDLAWAGTLNVRSHSPQIPGAGDNQNFSSALSTYFYAVNSDSAGSNFIALPLFVDPYFSNLNLNIQAQSDTSFTNALTFSVSSSDAASTLYLTATIGAVTPPTLDQDFIPLNCAVSGGCVNTAANVISPPTTGQAVSYNPTGTNIGFNPADICAYASPGTLGNFCNGNNVNDASTAATTLQIIFQVYTITGNNGGDITSYTSSGFPGTGTGGATIAPAGTSTSGSYVVSLVTAGAASPSPSPSPSPSATSQGVPFNCPSTAAEFQSDLHPGDGNIGVLTDDFVLAGTSGDNSVPIGNLIVSGATYSSGPTPVPTPDTASDYHNNGPFPAIALSLGGFQSVPVTNATSQNDYAHWYEFAFMTRDLAGIVNPIGSNGGICIAGPIDAVPIQGFLTKSNCFIATAAFRSIDTAPVLMLRKFRDQILLHHGWGKSFVKWYYGWSPPHAVWLMEHEEFRHPVLLGLIPLEVLAWLLLHPVVLGAWFLFSIFITLFCLTIKRREI